MKLCPILVAVAVVGVSSSLRAEPETPTAPATAAAPAPAAVAPKAPAIALTAEGLNQRYEFIGNLIERSSSARQLEKSGSPEGRQMQQQAREARSKAKEAIAAGNLAQADALLKESTQLMMKGVRMAHPEEASVEKHKTDFNNRKESVKALLATGKRVAGEKGASKPELAKAEGLLKEADELAAAGKVQDGRVKLDQAYLLIKDSVRGMREGEEIRADKNFATKEDEYRYEQARNDDYQGLIAGVIQGKDDPSWGDAAKKGRSLREDADGIASSKDFEAALKKINESTNQLKSILRRAGFPII